ncbi:hypothetical protein NC653_014052 [Populus alba x Populus x berolinensis]|uniref:C2H2-type domain-containing protein n=1 Tax=Populus alba x Populus x berolinensis TaxID=444605 RepID=A0AAD6QW25_9ROSI|nr:hypothetical protein NC653_014052 [Populus alba x Populus x berolinensis]
MATATVDSSVCNYQNQVHTESLLLIDLRHLSQPELLSLSFCSSSSLHRLQTDIADVSTPKIDRSVFNESAGSRKQTFSRLRLAPRNNNASSSSNSTPVVPFQITERHPLDEENSQILYLLKSLFGSDSHFIENNENNHNLVSVPVIYNEYMRLPCTNNAELQTVGFSQGGVKSLEENHLISTRIAESSSKKRKRGRPRKNENVDFGNNELVEREKIENKTIAVVCDDVEVQNKKKEEMEMVSKDGVVVDFVALGNMEDLYGEELRRRTEGMLGFSQGGVKSLEVNHLISTPIAESSSKKGKRGRPRKNEHVDFGYNELVERKKIENKTIAVVCDDVEVQNKKKEEMEMVSKNGVVVDFAALGNMEDPYGEELRRRTEGMLGFSQGGVKSLEVNHLISTPIAESSSKKRKRGRPRKNENVDFGNNELVERETIENKTITVVCDDVEVQNKKKEEMEMVSKNGVVVDFAALGNMEDPYGEELRRRTEGMLGFSQGGVKSLEVNHLISTPIAESSSKKRKRGRPRKNENVDFGNNELVERKKIENKTIAVVCDDVEVQNKKKEEMEMVSKNGVVVDFAALGNMEDPYGEELRRRTEGMLGFSQGGVKSLEVNHLISTPIAESSSKKRKRGRPRKNENVDFGNNELVERNKIENKTIAVACDNVEVQNKKKEEMEMVSKNGVVVDFMALGNMEDPYGEELRRRTEGMQLKAEFLGFLEGFEGEWGSTRKKRRIVDASLFGDALPIGWKLSICVKKQAGRVWLACTRYISHPLIVEDVYFDSILNSPNGLQFVSCKEVSSYLLSFSGLHDVRQLNYDHMDGRIKLTDKIAPSISADQTCKDGKNENDSVSYKALPVTSTSTETGGCLREIQTGMNYECHKCTLTFDEQDDLLQHLLSSHQRSPKQLKCGTSTNEEVIIKNGKYECQFCLKLFEERHHFNGHLGNHIKDYFKKLDASSDVTTQKNDEPASVEIPFGAVKIQTSIDIDRDSDEITSDTKSNGEINSTIPYCEMKANTSVEAYCGKQDRVSNISNEVGKMNEVTDIVAAEISVCSEPALLSNENNAIHRSSDETNVPRYCTNIIDDLNCSVAGDVRNLACINLNQVPPRLIEELNQERGSDSCLLAPNAKENMFNDDIIEDRNCSSTIDNMVSDDWDTDGKGEPITGSCAAIAENFAANLKEQRSSEGCSVGLFNSNAVETMQEKSSKGDLTGIENMYSVCTGMLSESKFDDVGKPGTNELKSVCRDNNTVLVDDHVAINEGKNHGDCPVIPFLNEQMHLVENNITGTPKCTIREPCQEEESEGGLLTLSGNEQSFDLEGNVIKVSKGTINVVNHNEVLYLKNNEFGSEIDQSVQTVTNIKQERSSNIFSFFPSTNGLTFASKDYGICNSKLEKLRQGRNSGDGPSHNEQSHDDENSVSRLSCTTLAEDKLQEAKTSCNGELCIAFGDNCTEQDADIVTDTVQEICFLSAGNQHTLTAKDNATGPFNGTMDELKQKMDSVESVLCLSSDAPMRSAEKNLHTAFTGSVQEEPRVKNTENSKKDDLGHDFSGHPGPNESVVSEFMWRNDEENGLRCDFADASQPVQASGFFPLYDTVSDKGESELFGETYGVTSGFEGLKSGGMENMEYNLLTSQVSSHSDESKIVSCDAIIPQGFDSSVCLEKGDLPFLPKNASRHHVPAVCVWCGREIRQEAFESEAQTSTMGFMCAECTARFSGQ